jgi:fibronectin-binding autotransporter adhesin
MSMPVVPARRSVENPRATSLPFRPAAESGRWRSSLKRYLKQTVFAIGGGTATILACQQAFADQTLNGNTYTVTTTTISDNFALKNNPANTIDINGKTATINGAFTGSGPITFTDTVGNGDLTLTSANSTYTGSTTIASGAELSLSGTASIADSGNPSSANSTTTTTAVVTVPLSSVIDNGTFDISAETAGTSITSLAGSGTVNLGAEVLTLSNAADTFSGVVTGTGGLVLNAGTETLTGVNTYTGLTTITSGSLILTGNGSIAASDELNDDGTFDISGTSGVSLASLSGTGRLNLGSQTLTLTDTEGAFSGVIYGTGNIVVASGTQYLSGANTFTGTMTVASGATLELGSPTAANTVANTIIDNGTLTFDSANTVVMSGTISGPGAVTEIGAGVAEITTAQTYTGATTITSGTLVLADFGTGSAMTSGSIAASSSVTVNGALEILTSAGSTLTSLSGSGGVELEGGPLTLSNASGSFTGTIFGTGALVLTGGTETLTGSNTYSGTTTISSSATLSIPAGGALQDSAVIDNGTLDISQIYVSNAQFSTIGSLSGNGTVTLGTHTLILADADDTFAGTISGPGGLTIDEGTETLSGANSYTGATTIASGSLILSSTGSIAAASKIADNGVFDISAVTGGGVGFASLSGTGTVDLGANTLTLSNAADTFSGVIAGSGGLVIAGGNEVLSGANTYTGGTLVDPGATLQIGDNSIGGSVQGAIADNGTLIFDRSDIDVVANVISGTGGLVSGGVGTTVLTAADTYTGGTTITVATLQIGNGGTTGSIVGNVTDNGTLAFDRSDTTNFGSVISGRGGVTAVGGTTVLTAADTFAGATAIDTGATLALGPSGSIAASSGVADNGTFDVSAASAPQVTSLSGSGNVLLGSQTLTLTNATDTFSGVISGMGGLTLTGGTQTLSGTNTYTGPTTVGGGTLVVNGSIATSSGVSVQSGATLGGTGTVSSVTLASGGTLAPGSAGAGTLNVNGTVAFASGSDFAVGLTSASSAKLTTTGAEALNGMLSVVSADGTYMFAQKVTVLTANGGVSGSFATQGTITAASGAVFKPTLSYDADDVYLEITLSKLSPALPTTATTNEKNVTGAVDAAIAASGATPLPQTFENLGNLSSADLAADASQLAGEVGADVPLAGRALFTPFLDALFDHIGDDDITDPPKGRRHPTPPDQYWVSFLGGSDNAQGDDTLGSHKFRSSLTGVVLGGNWSLTPDFQLGAALSAGSTHFRLVGDVGSGRDDALQAGVYGFVRYSPHFYGAFAAGFARDSVTTERLLTVSGNDDLTSKPDATVFGGRYETGVLLNWFTPYIAVQDELVSVPAYTEKAASGDATFALSYASRSPNDLSGEIGLRQSIDFDFTPRWTLTPDGILHLTDKIAFSHEFNKDGTADASFAALPSSSFAIDHAMEGQNAALVSFGAELKLNGGFTLGTHADTAFTSKSQSYTGLVTAGFTW